MSYSRISFHLQLAFYHSFKNIRLVTRIVENEGHFLDGVLSPADNTHQDLSVCDKLHYDITSWGSFALSCVHLKGPGAVDERTIAVMRLPFADVFTHLKRVVLQVLVDCWWPPFE